jgi:cell wall-associated NlpC family hydrolase
MQKIAFILLISIFLVSCKSAKNPNIVTKKSDQSKSTTAKRKIVNEETANYDVISNIVNNAKEYNGVRYKYGGTTSKGMDCSGLICTAFNSENIKLPRTSLAMSKEGSVIDLDDVQKGDLLFFQTNKNKKQVNHVGLVVQSLPGLVEFIHSTSSKGVIISNLNQSYWSLAFYQARRVL